MFEGLCATFLLPVQRYRIAQHDAIYRKLIAENSVMPARIQDNSGFSTPYVARPAAQHFKHFSRQHNSELPPTLPNPEYPLTPDEALQVLPLFNKTHRLSEVMRTDVYEELVDLWLYADLAMCSIGAAMGTYLPFDEWRTCS
jgi:hypothetical protein